MSQERHGLAWAHGTLAVQSLAGMLGPVLFLLPDGRQVAPLQVTPWANEPGRESLPGVLRQLRGDWPCVPFGFDLTRDLAPGWEATGETFAGAEILHGPGSNEDWTFVEIGPDRLVLECVYPEDHPVEKLRRTITPDPDAPAIDIDLEITVRRACHLPIGLHPTFRLTPRPGSVGLEPAAHGAILSYPGDFEPGATIVAENSVFAHLSEAPRRGGGTVDLTELPRAEDFEELLQIATIAGGFALHYRDEGFRAHLTWAEEDFPSVILWMSNRGRQMRPWNGRHLALGVEPVRAPFDLGPAVATAENPLAAMGVPTARRFDPAAPFRTSYRIGVTPA